VTPETPDVQSRQSRFQWRSVLIGPLPLSLVLLLLAGFVVLKEAREGPLAQPPLATDFVWALDRGI